MGMSLGSRLFYGVALGDEDDLPAFMLDKDGDRLRDEEGGEADKYDCEPVWLEDSPLEIIAEHNHDYVFYYLVIKKSELKKHDGNAINVSEHMANYKAENYDEWQKLLKEGCERLRVDKPVIAWLCSRDYF